MNRLLWRVLDWIYDRDQTLVEVDENHNYHIRWSEVALLPEFTLYELRCKVFKRHGLPFFGSCMYCGHELKPGDYIGWFEKYDPEGNEDHAILANPFAIMESMIRIGVHAKYENLREDANALFKEAHK